MKNVFNKLRNFAYAGSSVLPLVLGSCISTDERNIKDIYNVRPDSVRVVDMNKKSLELILDTSGSMKNKLNDKKRKIDIAKEVANEVLNIYKSYQDSTGGLEMGVLY